MLYIGDLVFDTERKQRARLCAVLENSCPEIAILQDYETDKFYIQLTENLSAEE